MRYRKVSEDGDFVFGQSENDYYQDVPEAVALAVKGRLLLWLGEWFLDIDEGTPYMQGILGKHSKAAADVTIQDRISGTEGFVSLEDFESVLDPDTRAYSASCTLNTIYGETPLQVANYVLY